jgi:selenocysteine lyase/cysteine desulfurase
MDIESILTEEALRRSEFPIVDAGAFFAHAGVAPLPRVAVEAMNEFTRRATLGAQENPWSWGWVARARSSAATLLGCTADEISLLGPTSLGLSLVANGLPWEPGDEVVYYSDDYPANVYPWSQLTDRGVKPVALQPQHPGAITWDLVESAITERTRLVALASCHFLSGYRIDVDTIGRNLHERGILFCLDAIQTLGAFPTSVEHVDFLSADSHKWMLGPAGAGILYVDAHRAGLLKPTLLGSWNVVSPEFVAQDTILYERGGRRYEPGMLNLPGIIGMAAALELLLDFGVPAIAERILELRRFFLDTVRSHGYRLYTEDCDLDPATPDSARSGIMSLTHPSRDMAELAAKLQDANIIVSLRQNRKGEQFVRFSPHFYNTHDELERAAQLMR